MNILDIVRREDDCLSLSRIMSIIIFILWMIASIYELFGKQYTHYEQITIAMLISLFAGLGNKYIESRFLTIKREDDKNEVLR